MRVLITSGAGMAGSRLAGGRSQAAQSFVPASWSAPIETLRIKAIGQVHLFEAWPGSITGAMG